MRHVTMTLVLLLAGAVSGCRAVALGGREQGTAVRKAFIAQAQDEAPEGLTLFDGDDAKNTYAKHHIEVAAQPAAPKVNPLLQMQ